MPLWASASRRGGRWNLSHQDATQYAALSAEAPFAELIRHENLRTEEEAAMLRTTLWQLRVDEGALADYSTFEKAEEAGFPPEALVDDDHERCQAEAAWLRSHGLRGVLGPSAALPGSTNLTLFGPRVAVQWDVPPKLAFALPVQRLATGAPPRGLVGRVCYYGQAHAGLRSYVATRRGGAESP